MELKTFIDKVRAAKGNVNKERTKQTITVSNTCALCKHKETISVEVEFYKSHNLTIFEANLVDYLFGLNQKPPEYHQYHECPRRKRIYRKHKGD